MRRRNIIFVFLFIIFIAFNYLNLISRHLSDFEKALELHTTSGIPIYLTEIHLWIFDIISLFYNSIIIAIAVGLVGYYVKELKLHFVLLFGLLLRYITFILFIPILLYNVEKVSISYFVDFIRYLDLRNYIMISLQPLFAICFSYLGFHYGRRVDYFDTKDMELFYFCGIPKKIWLLLFISFNPVVQFLSKLTIVQIYEVIEKITSMTFWKDTFSLRNIFGEDSAGGLGGLLGHGLVIFFAWAIAIVLFSFGLSAIRNKDANLRWLKICFIFVLLPSMIIIVPIIRNRTWFF